MKTKLRKIAAISSLVSAGVAFVLTGCIGLHQSRGNPRDSGAFATGHYRNLFAENGHSPKEIRVKVDSAFQQLFHGDPTRQTIYYSAGSNSNGPLAYITDIKHNDVRTEGLSYGMMIAVQMDKKAEFDALWNWSLHYLYHSDPADPGYGFFAWQARTNGDRMSQGIAPDGEEYYTMALYFAAGRWGSGKGIYNYKAEADKLLSRMRHRAVITGASPRLPNGRGGGQVTAGPLFDETNRMVLFVPEYGRGPFFTDPSYHLPAFYELWARWGPAEDRDFWLGAAQNSRDYFAKVAHPLTGLTPHDSSFDGSLRGGGRGGGGFGGFGGPRFDYDAFRTAGNWSVDWSWWAKDPRERELSDKLQAFFESKGMTNYGCQFTLDGTQTLDARHAQGLVAVNAEASLAAADSARAQKFVEALWNTPPPDGLERYYEGLLYMMALLHCSGEFRVWAPH
ncbi:MAG TPA: glycosyl hydrolase family 8 [Verrucomicrobiae bacterium]